MTTETSETTELAPRDRRAVDDLRLVMTNLAGLIEAENDALTAHNIDTVKALSASKWTLTRNYRNQMQAVADAPDMLKLLEVEERTLLRELGERLNRAAKRNELLLSANIDAANRVMHAVVEGVRKAQERGTVYSRSGALHGVAPDGRPLAVSYNKEL